VEDNAIIDLYWNRDESAITETDLKYGRYLAKIANNILNDEEDCRESLNDTYLGAWNSMPPNRPSILSSYLAAITRRSSIDIFRRRTREKRRSSEYALSLSELGDCIPGRDSTTDEADIHLLADSINAFLRTLPSDARNTFIGRYYFLDSLRDVAAYCGMSETKAKSLLHRTRLSLKRHLEQEGFSV
jgi:RNA polymerase sigma-70 factor (ECF subfamily)